MKYSKDFKEEALKLSDESEDIDLILDWRVLGYEKDEPWEKRSNTKQDLFNKEANKRTEVFLKDTIMPSIAEDLSKETTAPFECYIDETEPQNMIFGNKPEFEMILKRIKQLEDEINLS